MMWLLGRFSNSPPSLNSYGKTKIPLSLTWRFSSLEKVNAETSGLATSQNEIQRFIELEALAGYETIQQIKTIKRRVDLDLKSIQ